MSIEKRPPIAPASLAEFLMYEPKSGRFTWRVRRGSTPAGTKAGTISRGNIYIAVGRIQFRAASLAGYLMTGEWRVMDHKDGDRLNLSWSNLIPLKEPSDADKLYLQCFDTPDGWNIVSNLPDEFVDVLRGKLEKFSK